MLVLVAMGLTFSGSVLIKKGYLCKNEANRALNLSVNLFFEFMGKPYCHAGGNQLNRHYFQAA
ncbi:hypothetical protein BWP33_05785 [Simonsiella muelleri ATCC 29453]|nr:hypothetical protein BWP33_05785 [Simonsiella muelleri ATCC 29453]